jgi:hypothetical protein
MFNYKNILYIVSAIAEKAMHYHSYSLCGPCGSLRPLRYQLLH